MSFCARVTGEGLAGSDPAEMVGGWPCAAWWFRPC